MSSAVRQRKYRNTHLEQSRASSLKCYRKNRTKYLEAQRVRRAAKREEVNAAAARWRADHPNYLREWHQANKVRRNQIARDKTAALRKELIEAYGGKCACCGEPRPEFMTIDHIGGANRDVDVERGCKITGYRLYFKLKSLGFPKDCYQLLCFSCNGSIGAWGYCPHERERQKLEEVA